MSKSFFKPLIALELHLSLQFYTWFIALLCRGEFTSVLLRNQCALEFSVYTCTEAYHDTRKYFQNGMRVGQGKGGGRARPGLFYKQ